MCKIRSLSFAKDSAGVSAVEFAIIMPVFMVMLMGAIEFGLIVFTFNAAQNAARDVARQLASNRITATSAAATAQGKVPSWVSSSTTVSVSQTTPGTASTNQFTVDIYIPAPVASVTGFLSWTYRSLILHASVTMQQEPTL